MVEGFEAAYEYSCHLIAAHVKDPSPANAPLCSAIYFAHIAIFRLICAQFKVVPDSC